MPKKIEHQNPLKTRDSPYPIESHYLIMW